MHALDFLKPLAQRSTWKTSWMQSESFRTAKLRTKTEVVLLLLCSPCTAAATHNSFQFLFALKFQLFGWILPVHHASRTSPRVWGQRWAQGTTAQRVTHPPQLPYTSSQAPAGPDGAAGLVLPSQTGTFRGQTAPAWGRWESLRKLAFWKNVCHINGCLLFSFLQNKLRT